MKDSSVGINNRFLLFNLCISCVIGHLTELNRQTPFGAPMSASQKVKYCYWYPSRQVRVAYFSQNFLLNLVVDLFIGVLHQMASAKPGYEESEQTFNPRHVERFTECNRMEKLALLTHFS